MSQTRSPSSSTGSDDECSPTSHSTQLINIPEMAAQVAAEQQQQDRAIAAAAATAALEQQQRQQVAADAAIDLTTSQQQLEQRGTAESALDIVAAAGQQQRQQQILQEGQPPSAGLNARPLGSEEYSGSGDGGCALDGDTPGDEEQDRDLSVACQQAEENKLSFQLKFTEPEGERQPHFVGLIHLGANRLQAEWAVGKQAGPSLQRVGLHMCVCFVCVHRVLLQMSTCVLLAARREQPGDASGACGALLADHICLLLLVICRGSSCNMPQ